MLYESFFFALKRNPLIIFFCFYWLLFGGKALLKQKLALNFVFDPQYLPYNQELVSYLRQLKQSEDCEIYLVSASYVSIVEPIAKYWDFFTGYFATNSDGINLSGRNKADFLNERFGKGNYTYAGNSNSDLKVWSNATCAICVNTPNSIISHLKKIDCRIDKIIITPKTPVRSLLKAIRVHQWSKNLLLFVPLITTQLFFDYQSVISLLLGFGAFCLMASFVYILNDLLDLESDRMHPIKCKRPFAAGSVSLQVGLSLMPFLFITSIMLAYLVSDIFINCLFIYLIVTTLYSFKLKQVIILDCLTLSFLYTFRMLSGIVALQVSVSLWLVTFSGFFFLALAIVKRMAELKNQEKRGNVKTAGRGYLTTDLPILSQIGVSCGFMSTLVFALYVNSSKAMHFPHPMYVYICGPILVFWFCYIFFVTHRGQMNEDPVMFAAKDPFSLLSGLLFMAFFLRGVIA